MTFPVKLASPTFSTTATLQCSTTVADFQAVPVLSADIRQVSTFTGKVPTSLVVTCETSPDFSRQTLPSPTFSTTAGLHFVTVFQLLKRACDLQTDAEGAKIKYAS